MSPATKELISSPPPRPPGKYCFSTPASCSGDDFDNLVGAIIAVTPSHLMLRLLLCLHNRRDSKREEKKSVFDSPQPVTLRQRRVTANRIVLIREPNGKDDVESSRGVVEEFRHYCFHA